MFSFCTSHQLVCIFFFAHWISSISVNQSVDSETCSCLKMASPLIKARANLFLATLRAQKKAPQAQKLSTTVARYEAQVHPNYLKVKERQKQFQIDNGLNVSPKNLGYQLQYFLLSITFVTMFFRFTFGADKILLGSFSGTRQWFSWFIARWNVLFSATTGFTTNNFPSRVSSIRSNFVWTRSRNFRSLRWLELKRQVLMFGCQVRINWVLWGKGKVSLRCIYIIYSRNKTHRQINQPKCFTNVNALRMYVWEALLDTL